jgi:Rieske 2Fe-2S family protein
MGSGIGLSDEIVAELKRTRANLHEAQHLPGFIYTSKEIFQHEVDTIFMKEWLCVGRIEELAKPGDYLAVRIAREPALVCRNNEGQLRAFRNTCQHRGVEVVSGQGNLSHFTCPYHAWMYDLNGNLKGAPYAKDLQNFDLKTCSLPSINVDTWGGYVFINFDVNSQSLADYLDADGIRAFCDFLKPEATRMCDKWVFELPCNWKFVPENVMDMYHVGVIHKESFGGYFPLNDFRYHIKNYGYYATYESFTMAPKGATLFGTMPWLRGKVTDKFACTAHIRPTMNLFGRHDLIQPLITTPIDVDRTQVTVYTQLPEEYFAEPAFAEKVKIYADFIRLVLGEDSALLESLQNGVMSRHFKPGPTVGLERAIHHFLNYFLDKLIGDDPSARAHRIAEADAFIRESQKRNGNAPDGGYSQNIRQNVQAAE